MMVKAFKRVFPVLLISLSHFPAMAQLPQQRTVDSLQALVPKAVTDTARILLLSKLSAIYFTINNQKGIEMASEALKMSKQIGYNKGIYKAYYALGNNYWAKYDYIKAQNYYGLALKIAEESRDKKWITACLGSIGMCYEAENNFSEAIGYYNEELKIDEGLGGKNDMENDLSALADVYIAQSKYAEALQTFKTSLNLAKQSHNEAKIAYCDRQIGEIYLLLNNYSESLKWAEVAVQLYKKLNSYDAEAGVLGVLGDTYLKFKDYPAAVLQYKKALDLLDQVGNHTAKGTAEIGSKADFYFSLGKAYLDWGGLTADSLRAGNRRLDPDLIKIALKNFKLSFGLAKSKGYIENMANSLKNISLIQSSIGRYQEAFKTYKEYVIYRDSFDNSEKDKIYKQHELAFEYAQKRDSLDYAGKLQKKEIAQVRYLADDKLKQRSLYAVVAIVILLFIVFYFVFRSRIQKINFKSQLANEKADKELKQALFENKLNDLTLASLKAQMNPHFIFNCLNSIKFYIETNDTDAASLYITKFSKLIRNILDSARSEKVMLPEEIELIKLYLDMEVMRLKNRLCYELVIDDNIDVDFIEIPPLFIQPYVENAIWHGIMNKAEGGFVKLMISGSPDQKYLVINITDNGVGRKRSAEIKSNSFLQHASHGTKLNNERIEIFNAKYKTNTEVATTDLYDETNQPCGTSVTIQLLIA